MTQIRYSEIVREVGPPILGTGDDSQSFRFGLVNSREQNVLTYATSQAFLDEAVSNRSIAALFVPQSLEASVVSARPSQILFLVEDAAYTFWQLRNNHMEEKESYRATHIDPSANIHASAQIDKVGVEIGPRTVIGANVSILRGTRVGGDCRVGPNSAIGFDGFEHKLTTKGWISCKHDGMVVIEDAVTVGALNSIARGFSWRNTIVGSRTRTDSLVHIAHGVQIGSDCVVTAGAEISGSVTIGKSVWLGPNCCIIDGISLGDGCFVGIGAVVTEPVRANDLVAGNPARVLKQDYRWFDTPTDPHD